MADMMQFDLVSPERLLASVEASEIRLPGTDGDLTAMPDHAPVITTLRAGIVQVVGAGETLEYAVSGGFAEVTGATTSVLAERAYPVSEMTKAILDEFVSDTAEARDNATTSQELDALAKQVADIAALGAQLGLTA